MPTYSFSVFGDSCTLGITCACSVMWVYPHTRTHIPTAVDEDVTTYSSLIGEVHEVHDDSSDFELPDTVVA